MLRDIKNSGNVLLSLINDILDVSKVEAGKMELIPVRFDMYKVVDEVVGMMAPKIREKELKFNVEIDNTLPSGYIGDDVRIRQILLNLLNNASKYTSEGSVTFSLCGEEKEGYAELRFSVKDTGIGIKPEGIKKLSQSFVRLEEEKNRKIEGTGLGITIVNNFLKLMDSELKIESEYGKGSDFSFTLNLEISDWLSMDEARFRDKNREWEKNLENEQADDSQEPAEFKGDDYPQILVVDDNSVNIKVFKGVLKKSHVIIDSASSGKEAVEIAGKVKYRAIFMDHMMPEMDGIETVEKMRSIPGYLNADTPIVALTANAVKGVKEMFEEHGFYGFISKPFNADELIAFVEDIVRK